MYSVGCFSSKCVGGCVFPAFVIQNLSDVLSSLAGRNVQRRLLQQYMCGGLCVSCLRNPESVDVLSSLAARNVQRRLLQQYMCGGLCVSCLRNPESVDVLNSLAGRNVQRRLLQQVYVWGAVCFPPFVIRRLL